MKILLDTSYLLPLIKVGVERIPENLLITLLGNRDHELSYSILSIFELAAKGIKLHVKEGAPMLVDIFRGIDALQNEARLKPIAWVDDYRLLELTKSLREIHSDFIDCVIVASAVTRCDVIATLDDDFHEKITRSEVCSQEIISINPDFAFWFGGLKSPPEKVVYVDETKYR
ncbi:MAG: PIN domain-containing protein [Promethearchaeota archaeon]